MSPFYLFILPYLLPKKPVTSLVLHSWTPINVTSDVSPGILPHTGSYQ